MKVYTERTVDEDYSAYKHQDKSGRRFFVRRRIKPDRVGKRSNLTQDLAVKEAHRLALEKWKDYDIYAQSTFKLMKVKSPLTGKVLSGYQLAVAINKWLIERGKGSLDEWYLAAFKLLDSNNNPIINANVNIYSTLAQQWYNLTLKSDEFGCIGPFAIFPKLDNYVIEIEYENNGTKKVVISTLKRTKFGDEEIPIKRFLFTTHCKDEYDLKKAISGIAGCHPNQVTIWQDACNEFNRFYFVRYRSYTYYGWTYRFDVNYWLGCTSATVSQGRVVLATRLDDEGFNCGEGVLFARISWMATWGYWYSETRQRMYNAEFAFYDVDYLQMPLNKRYYFPEAGSKILPPYQLNAKLISKISSITLADEDYSIELR